MAGKRKGKKQKEPEQEEQLTTETELEAGYKAYGLDEDLRKANVAAIKYYAEAIEKSKRKDNELGIETNGHKRLLRLLTGSDSKRGLLQIFDTEGAQQQKDLVYDELEIPLDTEIRDALKQIEIEGTDLHLIATLSPEQKRNVIDWVKRVMEARMNGKDKEPGMPEFINELFPKVMAEDELMDGIDPAVRDDLVRALDVLLGKSPYAEDIAAVSKSDIEVAVAFRFEEIAKDSAAGFLNHTTLKGNEVALFVAGGVYPYVAYGVAPKTFKSDVEYISEIEEQALATLHGDQLFNLAFRMWKVSRADYEIVDGEAPADSGEHRTIELVKDEEPTGEEITMGTPAVDAGEGDPEGFRGDEYAIGAVDPGTGVETAPGSDGYGEVETIPAPTAEQQQKVAELKKAAAAG